jgi:membrane-associated phospholipid phosphatase
MIESQTHSQRSLGLHLFVGLLVIALGILLFGLLARSVPDNAALVQFDQNLALALHAWARPVPTTIFIFFSLLGFQVLWGIVLVVGVVLAIQRRWTYLITWAVAWAGGEILNQLLKQLFARPRPVFADPLQSAANYSFPSGHAMFSVIAYGVLAYFVLLGLSQRWQRIAVIVGTLLLVWLIGLSRIYLGVHYFSDVVAGYAAGSAWLSICITSMETVRWRSTHPTSRRPVAHPG